MISKARRKLIEYLATVKRATVYHWCNRRDLWGDNHHTLINAYYMFRRCEDNGLIRKSKQDMDSVYGGKARTQYYELDRKASEWLEVPDASNFSVTYPHFMHQYGLQTSVTSIYFAFNKTAVIDYDCKDYKYRPDAVMDNGKKYIIEFERSKGLDELEEEIRKRDKLVNDATFLYVINSTKSKNKASSNLLTVKPIDIYDKRSDQEARVEDFLDMLLARIKDLPSWKYRFQCLHNFDRFHESIWKAPGNKSTFKLR